LVPVSPPLKKYGNGKSENCLLTPNDEKLSPNDKGLSSVFKWSSGNGCYLVSFPFFGQ
jgi:hypothetical protein